MHTHALQDKNNIDFCSIDIDGLDLEIFETFKKFMPSVVCIEGGQMLHPYHKRVERNIAKRNIQQSLKVMVASFEKKGSLTTFPRIAYMPTGKNSLSSSLVKYKK